MLIDLQINCNNYLYQLISKIFSLEKKVSLVLQLYGFTEISILSNKTNFKTHSHTVILHYSLTTVILFFLDGYSTKTWAYWTPCSQTCGTRSILLYYLGVILNPGQSGHLVVRPVVLDLNQGNKLYRISHQKSER